MIKWNKCIKVYSDGEFVDDAMMQDIRQAFMFYYQMIGTKKPEYNVWYDAKEKECFGQDLTWLNANSRESFFISDKKNFLKVIKVKNFLMYFQKI